MPNIISFNTKPSQEYFLSNHLIKRRHTSKHYVKLGFVDPIIGLDVLSGDSPIEPEMVENTPIFNSNPQDQQRLDCDHESNVKSQEWNELIVNKKSVMEIIFDWCDEETRAEVAINSSYKDTMKAGDLIKFLKQMQKICNDSIYSSGHNYQALPNIIINQQWLSNKY